MKRLITFCVLLCSLVAGFGQSYTITVDITVVNHGSCDIGLPSFTIGLLVNGVEQDWLNYLPVGTYAPAGGSYHISEANVPWPINTLPSGTPCSVAVLSGGNNQGSFWGGSDSYSGYVLTASGEIDVGEVNTTNVSVGLAIPGVRSQTRFFLVADSCGNTYDGAVFGSGGETGYAVSGADIDSHPSGTEYLTVRVPVCCLPCTAVEVGYMDSAGTNNNGGYGTNALPTLPVITNSLPNLPQVTNALPVSVLYTNYLPSLPAGGTAGGILWTPNNGTRSAEIASVQQSGDQSHVDLSALVNAIDQMSRQSHSDFGSVNNELVLNGKQDHSDLNAINNSVLTIGAQAHSDANGLHSDLQSILAKVPALTNGNGGLQLTNYASESTLELINSNIVNLYYAYVTNNGANGAATNILVGISNVLVAGFGTNLSSILQNYGSNQLVALGAIGSNLLAGISGIGSNMLAGFIHFTNLNYASETTLGAISSNLFNLESATNLDIATEATQAGISNLLSDIRGRLGTNGLGNGTNSVNVIGTNQYYSSESTLAGISNLLAGAGGGTNLGNTLELDQAGTNGAAALAKAHGLVDGVLGGYQDLVDNFNNIGTISIDPGHTAGWEFDFCGQQCDLDPANNFPSVARFSMGVWSFILLAAYFLDVGRVYLGVIKTYSTQHTGGVPNIQMQFGAELFGTGGSVGGNFIGLACAVIVPSVFVGLWIGVITMLGATGLDWVGGLDAIADVIAQVNGTVSGAMACHMLGSFLPVVLAIRLIVARLVLYFTLAKVVILASSASRYLFGR